jgi:hypothetical protein
MIVLNLAQTQTQYKDIGIVTYPYIRLFESTIRFMTKNNQRSR